VIAGFLPAAHLSVHLCRDEAPGERRAEQQLVDPKPASRAQSVPKEFSGRVDALSCAKEAQGGGPALGGQMVESVSTFGRNRASQSSARAHRRSRSVGMVLAGENDRLTRGDQFGGMRGQRLEPTQLIIKLRPRRGGCRSGGKGTRRNAVYRRSMYRLCGCRRDCREVRAWSPSDGAAAKDGKIRDICAVPGA
jgi:hypothetical protein